MLFTNTPEMLAHSNCKAWNLALPPMCMVYKLSNLGTSNFCLPSTSLQKGRNDDVLVNPKPWARQIDDKLDAKT
jgi:hypothetical protein